MDQQLAVILFLIGFGLIFGYLTARSSIRREKIHGGPMSFLFHYLASGLMATLPLAVLSSVFILRLHFFQIILIAIGFFAAVFLLLFLFARFEGPAYQKAMSSEVDRGWTEHDARTSGL